MLIGLAVLAIWAYLLAARGAFWIFRDSAPGPLPSPAPRIVAVIPARDEADVVAHALASLAQQKYPGEFHIVLVDDDSRDGTAEAARAAVPDPLLQILRAEPLPPGWTGKLWAVSQGVRYAARFAPDYLLLTDADIVHAPGNLTALAARASTGFDLVSYMATLECRTPAERALIPAFVFFFFLLYPPAWIASARHATAGAAGGCMLIRRSTLERIGGIESIRGELIDDCALARKVKSAGGRVWLGLSTATRSIRQYATFAEIGRMISRSAFTQLRHSALLLAGTVLGLAIAYLAPPILLLNGGWSAALGAAAWLMMSLAYIPALRFYRCPAWWAPLLPAIAIFYAGATIHSAVSYWRGHGGQWKGRAQDAL